MKKCKKWVALVLAMAMFGTMLTGCGSNKETTQDTTQETTQEEVTQEEVTQEEVTEVTEETQTQEEETQTEKKGVLMMATTTSTADTGLLDYLAPIFLEQTGWELQWTAVGTGEALKMGENGDVDIVLVHSKASEEEFVANGYGVERVQVMYNDFVIVGPTEPIAHNGDAAATFQTIYNDKLAFISRGDDSGTHKKEVKIWEGLGVNPADNENFLESGQGMGTTITMAAEKNAYCLSDRGTWLKMKTDAETDIALEIVCEGAADLLNQYGIIAVNPEKYPDVNNEAANAMITWICSEEIQELIGNYGVDTYGQALFTPNANE